MVPKTCSIPECAKGLVARGWCFMHYQRWRKHGDPLYVRKFPSKGKCSIDGCETTGGLRKTWCGKHYKRWYKYGNPNTRFLILDNDKARFDQYVEKTDTCWHWTSTVHKDGYAHFKLDGREQYAHRVAYERFIGPIPEGREVDHTCFVRHCVNPDHLRVTTRKQNQENHQGPQRNNTSGVRGVSWRKDLEKWAGHVSHQKRKITVGYFETLDEAEAAVIAKRLELHTHNDLDRIAA